MSTSRRFAVPLGLLASLAVVALAQDPGELNQAILQMFGGPVSPRRADGSAAQTGDVPTRQSNGSVAYAAPSAGGSQTPWTSAINGAGYALTGVGAISASSASISGTTSATVTAPTMAWSGQDARTLSASEACGQTYYSSGGAQLEFTLPTPAQGLRVAFVASDGAWKINTASETSIALPDDPTIGDGGYLLSKSSNATIMLESLGSQSNWRVVAITGTWAQNSTTSAGYAYTPTPWTALTSISHTWDADADVSEAGYYRQSGDVVEVDITLSFAGAPPASSLTLSAITGHVSFLPDEAKMQELAPGVYDLYMCGGIGTTCSYDASVAFNLGIGTWYSESANNWQPNVITLPGTLAAVSDSSPWTWASGDKLHLRFSFPVQ